MNNTQLFDPLPIEELRKLDQDSSAGLVDSLIDMFETSATSAVKEMQEAIRDARHTELGNLAHSMKSSSGNVGAMEFSSTCAKIEELAKFRTNELSVVGGQLVRHLIDILPETLTLLSEQRSKKT